MTAPVAYDLRMGYARKILASQGPAAIALAGLTLVYLISIFYTPEARAGTEYFTICGFKNLTGLPCPGCGLTNSFCSLGKGDLSTAFSYHLLGPPLFLFSIIVWLRSLGTLFNWHGAVRAIDLFFARLRPVRFFVAALALFGLMRIMLLLFLEASLLENNALLRLLSGLARI
jgi:hypothetical protein